MAKTIIFCADGTWNGPGETEDAGAKPPTSVLKLFLNVAGTDAPETMLLKNEQERTLRAADGSVTQVGKYLHGVGDLSKFLFRTLGGAVGIGNPDRLSAASVRAFPAGPLGRYSPPNLADYLAVEANV